MRAELKVTVQPLKDKSIPTALWKDPERQISLCSLLEQQKSAVLVKHQQQLFNSAIWFPQDTNYRFYMVKQILLPGVTEAPLSPSESKTRNAKRSCHEWQQQGEGREEFVLENYVVVTVSTIPTVTVLQIF